MAKLKAFLFSDIENAKEHYYKEIDKIAEYKRSQFIVSLPGQSMTYEAKFREATRYPKGNRFPFLEAEAEALDITIQEVADSILLAYNQWEEIGSKIEGARKKAKRIVERSTRAEDMHKVVEYFHYSLSGLSQR